MSVQWKQQHINNACLPACLAMLLSQYNIQKEDYDIIYESKQPYLLEFDQNRNCFMAGVLIQSPEVLNIVPAKFNLTLVNCKFDNFEQFFDFAVSLLNAGQAFVTSLAQGYIPAPGYQQNNNESGHAVVACKFANDKFYFFDPDGGIDRKKKFIFDEVKHMVAYDIAKNEVQKILQIRDKFLIGYLKEQTDSEAKILNLLKNSKHVFENLSEIFTRQTRLLQQQNKIINYHSFYDFIIRIIKPLALDLKNALLTIPKPTPNEKELIARLEVMFQKTIRIQKISKENPNLLPGNHFTTLTTLIAQIRDCGIKVVNDEIQKYA